MRGFDEKGDVIFDIIRRPDDEDCRVEDDRATLGGILNSYASHTHSRSLKGASYGDIYPQAVLSFQRHGTGLAARLVSVSIAVIVCSADERWRGGPERAA